jgi:CubicO group peptidase (beta-lactamase class C family)
VWQHYAGVANAETKTPISADSLFPCCSLGKPVFAWVVLRLAQEGKIDLDRPLNEYLKDDALTGQFGDRVTGRHVLSHSTGLDNWRWEKGRRLTPRFEPGTKFGYSGEGFYHLQRVLEGITGVGCEAFMQERVFKPLGMDSSTYLWRGDANERLVAGHKGGDPMYNRDLAIRIWKLITESKEPLSHFTHERIVAALVKDGGLAPEPNEIVPNVAFSMLSTVSVYSRFLTALVEPGDRVLGLSATTRKAMQTAASHINSALSWGLGIGVENVEGRSYLWQWGDNGGWKDFLLAEPSTQSAMIVFTNRSNGMHVNERIARDSTGVEHPAFLWI